MGLTLIASKNKDKLIQKLTREASSAVDSYADLSPLEVTSASIDQAEGSATDRVSQTFYVPILFPNCQEPQWALVDTGA
jgi:hypothetical protein